MTNKHTLIVAYASLAISLAAAAFSGWQAYDTRSRSGASPRPLLSFTYQTSEKEPMAGIKVANVGLGPALVQSITYYVDRNPVKDAEEVITYGKLNNDLVDEYWDFDEGEAIPAGESFWLVRSRHKEQERIRGVHKLHRPARRSVRDLLFGRR